MEIDMKALDYEYAQSFFMRWDSLHDASTWHGWLSGHLAAREDKEARYDKEPWHLQAMMWLDISEVSLTQDDELFLKAFFEKTKSMLAEKSEIFHAIVPDKKRPLIERVSSVSFWAESFLLGFASVDANQSYLNKETQDALQGLADISQVKMEDESDAELEPHFEEILGHLNLLVQVIFSRDTIAPKTIH